VDMVFEAGINIDLVLVYLSEKLSLRFRCVIILVS